MCCFRYGCADAPHSLMRPKVLRYCYNTKRNHACSAPSPQLTHTAALFSLCRSHSAWLRVLLSLENCFVIHAADRAPCVCARMTRRLPSHPATCPASWLRTYISRHRSSQLRRRDSLSNFIHAYVAGRRSSSLPSCLLPLLVPAWLLPRSQAPIELSGSVTVDMSRRKETNILFII